MSIPKDLVKLRKKIDLADRKIVSALGERFKITEIVGRLKKKHGLKAYDKEREGAMMASRTEWGKKLGLEAELVEKIFQAITKSVKKRHKIIKHGKK